ncbi:MAG: transferrin-binding protein-like solute binding protein [Oceanospirillaceae bacterium]|nr:transferrin-binding protein-like solute binding protein [Oceanospirillaceae bacterium]
MKQLIILPSFSLAVSSLLLVACNGDGSSRLTTSSPFTSWSAINPPQTVEVKGLSAESTYSAPAPDFLVTSLGTTRESDTTSAKLSYDADGKLTRVSITTPYSSVVWDESRGDLIEVDSGVILLGNSTETALGLAVDALELGWDYQTFGTWITGFETGSGRAGAFTIGAPTAGNRIPVNGSASFEGLAAGTYVDSGGEAYSTAGAMTVDANFLSRQLDFSTSDTAKINLNTLVESDANNLDLTGTLNYELGNNVFSGSVQGTGLDGTAKGQFYGPDAEEIGGYFNLRGAGVEAYRGAFGGRR